MLLKVLDGGSPDDYYQLKDTLFNQLDVFDTDELRDVLIGMYNYCYRMVAYKDNRFTKEVFDLHIVGLNHGCSFINSFFSADEFVEIFRYGLLLNKIEWVDMFFEKYKNKLLPNLRDNILNYCQGIYAFHKQDYDLAQEYLNNIDTTKDFFYHIHYKILLLQIYYDKNEFNLSNIDTHPINYELEALRQYLLPSTYKQMSANARERYSNFANFFKRILNRKKKLIYSQPLTKANIELLQTGLNDLQPLVRHLWLKEKVSELMEEVSKKNNSF